MDRSPPEPRSMEDDFRRALGELCLTAGALAVRLVRSSGSGCCANEASVVESGRLALHLTQGPCSLLEQGQAHLLIESAPEPALDPPITICAPWPLRSGDTMALQLDFPDAAAMATSVQPTLAQISMATLMWATEALERQALEAQLATVEERSRADLFMALNSHEKEREWLAYDVHDRIAETLASAYQQIQVLEPLTREVPEAREIASRASVLLRKAIQEAREIMNGLHPVVLQDLGLIPVVEDELRQLEQETGVRVKATLTSLARAPRDIEIVVYRVLHEALANIRTHSGAAEIVVSLACGSDSVDLRVEDNGSGFDVAAACTKRQVGGLMSMQRRAHFAHGSFDIRSAPGEGTSISVSIPWPRRRREELSRAPTHQAS